MLSQKLSCIHPCVCLLSFRSLNPSEGTKICLPVWSLHPVKQMSCQPHWGLGHYHSKTLLPFVFFHVSNFSCSLSFLFLFSFSTIPFPNGPEVTLTKVTHLDWIRRLMLFSFLSIPFPLLFKVLMQRSVPSKPSCSWWKKTQMTIPAHLRTSTTNPPIKETRGPSPTTSRSADSEDDLSNSCASVATLKGLRGVQT